MGHVVAQQQGHRGAAVVCAAGGGDGEGAVTLKAVAGEGPGCFDPISLAVVALPQGNQLEQFATQVHVGAITVVAQAVEEGLQGCIGHHRREYFGLGAAQMGADGLVLQLWKGRGGTYRV